MKKTLMALALLGMIFSCSTIDSDGPGSGAFLSNEQQITALDGSEWRQIACPSQEWIILNTYSLCNYFKALKFSGNSVYIQHNNSNPPTQHFICNYENTHIPLSVQACSNPTWKPFFWWDIVSFDNNKLIIDLIEIDRIGTMTNARFTFEKI
jgi:hypothetical protein